MLTFKFKNKRTNNIDKLTGEGNPNTFNTSSKKNIYKNINPRLNMTCKMRINGGGNGCSNTGCGDQCCLLSFLITDIKKKYYIDHNLANLFHVGNMIYSKLGEVGIIDAIIFPNACCQDTMGILSCGDGKDCIEKQRKYKQPCNCTEKKRHHYRDYYEYDNKRHDKRYQNHHCDKTWPLTVKLIVKASSGSCANPNYDEGYIMIDNTEIKGFTNLEGYDVIGLSSKGTPYLNPIFGYRKSLVNQKCCLIEDTSFVKSDLRARPKNDIYKDMHAKYTGKTNLLKNKKNESAWVPVTTNNNVCYSSIIRSGMQPKPDTHCTKSKTSNAKCDTNKCIIKNNYSYDYRQYLNNKSGKGWKRSQEKFFPMLDGVQTTLGGVSNGNCQPSEYSKGGPCSCEGNMMLGKTPSSKTIYKPNNRKFSSQGAVSAGSRLERLKLDTLRATNSKCDKKCKTITASNGKCTKTYKYGKGPYFAGKPRFTGWMYNTKHKEKVCLSQTGQQPFGIPQLTNKKRQTSNQFRASFPSKRGKVKGDWQRKNVCPTK